MGLLQRDVPELNGVGTINDYMQAVLDIADKSCDYLTFEPLTFQKILDAIEKKQCYAIKRYAREGTETVSNIKRAFDIARHNVSFMDSNISNNNTL